MVRRTTGASLAQLNIEFDVHPDKLIACARLERKASGAGVAPLSEMQEQENRRLRRHVATLRQEQALARKVAAYFTKKSRKGLP